MAASPTFTQQALMGLLTANTDFVSGKTGVVADPTSAAGKVVPSGTPAAAVFVTAGIFAIPGPAYTSVGPYLWTFGTGFKQINVQPGDSTNPRIDLIVARVTSAGTTDAAGLADCFIITGTPAVSPSDPIVQAGDLVLARVRVAANDATITSADIDDLRTFTGLRTPLPRTADPTLVSAPGRSATRVYFGLVTDTTDDNGRITWAHSIGTVPGAIVVEGGGIDGGPTMPAQHVTTSYTTTQATTRFVNANGVPIASASVSFRWVAYL